MAEENSGLFEDIDAILSTVDDTTFDEDDWNVVIRECASVSAKWEIVGGFLGLSISVIDNIKATAPATIVGCWHEALKNWIKQNYNTGKHALPSWKSLLAAVARVDRLLFKKLAAAHPAAEPYSVLSGREREMDAPEQSHQDTTYVFAPTPTTAPSSGHSNYEMTFPCLDLKKMSKEEEKQLHQRLYAESVEMIKKFQDLFSDTTQSLKKRKMTVKELLCNLVGLGPLPPAFNDLNLPVFRRHLPQLTKSKTIDEAMFEIGHYCSFFNFHMIEHIINKLGTRQDKKNLEKYREEFDKYVERHVFECPAEVGTVSEGLASMFVTLDETFNSCTVRGLDLFVENLRKTLKISTGAVFKLTHVAPGSLKLTFQLPYSLLQDIFPLSSEQEAALNGMGVANLWLIYQFNSTKVTTEGAMATNQKVAKDEDTASIADSALGTASVSGATFTGTQFSEDIVDRDLRDDPFLRMERDAAKPYPPDNSSQLELHRASLRGDLDEVKRLVEEKKLNPLEKDDNGETALHLAAESGHLDVTRYFIEEQSLVPACLGWHGWTPLHAAAVNNHLEVVDYLVAKQQVDPECQDEDGCTPLHRACWGGDVKVVSYLVNEMSKLTPLKDVLYHRTKIGNTPLHLAALNGLMEVVQLFISEYNVDPNTPGWSGRLPLHDAAAGGFLDLVKYLIEEQNTDPSCHDKDKSTPLHRAAANGRLDVVKYLTLDKHCNPLDRTSHGSTPLHYSALRGHLNIVDFFVSQLNIDPNTPGQWGRTPLHYAVEEGSLDLAKYLIEKKHCNPSCLDERKTTPLHLASTKGHLHIIAYLIKVQHCNPLAYDKYIGTPLHYAAHNGQLNVVKYFVQDLKCPQNIRGPRNTTPLEDAHAQGHTNVVKYLMSFL